VPRDVVPHLAVRLVLKHWDNARLPYLPGNSAAALESVETTLGVALPLDFREFYAATNGTGVPGRSGCDDIGWAFHALEDLAPWPDDPCIFEFADWMTQVFAVGIVLTKGEMPYALGGVYGLGFGAPYRIAESFSEFLDLYVCDDASLYPAS
jgi:hypothetical protein